jgi:nickel transport protein
MHTRLPLDLVAAAARATLATALLATIAAVTPNALAHEVLHSIERGRAIAVRAQFSDGEHLADCEYQVFAPSERGTAHQTGRTDRNGWLAFVPDAPGTWRVKIADASGHGVDIPVEASATAEAAGAADSGSGFVLRPLVGVLAIGALFAALVALHRRRAPVR